MLQPWEQDRMEDLTENSIKEDYREIKSIVDKLYRIFCENGEIKNFLESRTDSSPTVLEEVLKIQAIAEMYFNYCFNNIEFFDYKDIFYRQFFRIDEVRIAVSKLYKKLEKEYIKNAL